jgi:hypothetical protein
MVPSASDDDHRQRASLRRGLRAIRTDHVLLGAYLIDLNAMVFGAPNALFPALNHSVFGGGPSTLGLLYAAPRAGAFPGALTTGWLNRIRRQGLAIMVTVGIWGVAIAAFGLVRMPWIALVLLAVAGWADVLSAVTRTTVRQTHAGEALRNRIASVQIPVVAGARGSAASSPARSPPLPRPRSPSWWEASPPWPGRCSQPLHAPVCAATCGRTPTRRVTSRLGETGSYTTTTNRRWDRSAPSTSVVPSASSRSVPSGPLLVTVASAPGMNPASSR